MDSESSGTAVRRTLLIINAIILSAGGCGGPLISRLYFLRGGSRIWFSSWLETGGWPVILIPLLVSYTRRRGSSGSPIQMDWRVFLSAAVIGVLTGLDDYLYASGVARLPVSTSALIIATQLAFTAGFAFLIVRQRFTACSINAVVLLTVGAVVLGLHTGGDRPEGETSKEYLAGFLMTLGAAALYGFVLPVVELTYARAERRSRLTYTLVLEMQLVMCFFATLFCTVGMLINNDFQAISREAKEYQLGEARYYVVVICSGILWQCFFLGTIGVIFYSSSLLSGIIIAVLIPLTEVLAVIFYHEKFQPEKGISLFLSLWGFISYFYGEFKQSKNKPMQQDNQTNELQLQPPQIDA